MIPRWAHHAYAWTLGYFWIPCPRCGKEFGGHEHVFRDEELWQEPWEPGHWGRYKILCPACTRAGHRMRSEDPATVICDKCGFRSQVPTVHQED